MTAISISTNQVSILLTSPSVIDIAKNKSGGKFGVHAMFRNFLFALNRWPAQNCIIPTG